MDMPALCDMPERMKKLPLEGTTFKRQFLVFICSGLLAIRL